MKGVDISEHHLWNEHILTMAKNASRKLGFLNRSRKVFDSKQVLQIYKTFIRPCIEYCSQVWGGGCVTVLKRLDFIQRRAFRIIRNPALTDQIDSLQHRRNVTDLTIFYKYYHGICYD